MRLAVGPFPPTEYDRWPLYGSEALAPDFEIVPFHMGELVPRDVDATIWWSLEYHPVLLETLPGFKCAVIGDWHVHDPRVRQGEWDLVVGDYRYCKTHEDVNPLYWRQFSFDPRLHMPPLHAGDIDLCFMGRPSQERHPYLLRLMEWAKKSGKVAYITTDAYERGKEAAYYRRSKIVWNMSARGELNMRAYESAACQALSMIELGNDELWRSGAPLVGWQDSLLEETIEAWLCDEDARRAKVKEQWEWVQRERPVDHLRYLCEQIRERMENGVAKLPRVAVSVHDSGGAAWKITDVVGEQSVDYSTIAPPENEQRPEVCALVPAEAKVILDLGTHQGGLPYALKQGRPDRYVVGVDYDPRAKERCIHRMDEYHEYDLEKYRGYSVQPWGQRKYDCVVMADVLEHVKDSWGVLGAVRDLLAPGGCVVLSIPNIRNVANLYHLIVMGEWKYHVHAKDTWRGPQDNVLAIDHLRFWTRESVERLCTDAGYTVEQWGATYLGAPQLEPWTHDLSALIGKHGGNVEAWTEESHVIQWLVRARLTC